MSIPSRSWPHYGLHTRTLIVSDTEPGDDIAQVRINGPGGGGLIIALSPDQLDEIATDFQARAALMRAEVAR